MTTIVQISDPHLMSDRQAVLKGVPTAKALASVLEEARVRCPDPDCVVWTGDLSHEECAGGYHLLRELADDWIDKSLLIPGNHDSRVALREVFPEVGGKGDEPICFQAELGKWQLVGLDTPDQVLVSRDRDLMQNSRLQIDLVFLGVLVRAGQVDAYRLQRVLANTRLDREGHGGLVANDVDQFLAHR